MNDCEVPLDFFIVEPLEILVTEQVCLNSMTINVENALGNYAITWKDDAGALVGTGLTISDLEDGNYHLLIIDQPNAHRSILSIAGLLRLWSRGNPELTKKVKADCMSMWSVRQS